MSARLGSYYKSHEGYKYVWDDGVVADCEITTLDALRTNRLMSAIGVEDHSVIEIYTVEDGFCGEYLHRTKSIRLSAKGLDGLNNARWTYLHELSHMLLVKGEDHNLAFFALFGILLIRGNGMDTSQIFRLRYYDLQDECERLFGFDASKEGRLQWKVYSEHSDTLHELAVFMIMAAKSGKKIPDLITEIYVFLEEKYPLN